MPISLQESDLSARHSDRHKLQLSVVSTVHTLKTCVRFDILQWICVVSYICFLNCNSSTWCYSCNFPSLGRWTQDWIYVLSFSVTVVGDSRTFQLRDHCARRILKTVCGASCVFNVRSTTPERSIKILLIKQLKHMFVKKFSSASTFEEKIWRSLYLLVSAWAWMYTGGQY